MIKKLGFLFLLLFTLTSYALSNEELPPLPRSYVNDYANLLSTATRNKLNENLKQYQDTTTNQIIVAIFPGKVPTTIEDFSTRLEDKWKIGKKGKDNGVLLIIFPDDRQLRIEVGYGLEPKIPDSIANFIITQKIVPFFKQNKFDAGVESGVDGIIQAISATKTPHNVTENTVDSGNMTFMAIFALITGFLVGGGIGPIAGLIFCIATLGGMKGFLVWLLGFGVYIVIYHLGPASWRFDQPWRFLLGGFKSSRKGGDGDSGGFGGGGSSSGGGSSTDGGGFSGGGGGESGGGGASGRW